MTTIRGVIFDKDGTLFDFQATWGAWAAGFLEQITQGDAALARRLAERLGFDAGAGRFHRDSAVIAGTAEEVLALLCAEMPGRAAHELLAEMNASVAAAPLAEAVPLAPFLEGLRARGLALGVATNDAEAAALSHLHRVGVERLFDFVAGYDTGYGGKPAPGQLLGFCDAMGLPPEAVAMVGDSTHDLHAAQAAGMHRVAVLTGVAGAADLAPHADVVLPDIGHLPAWLERAAQD